MTTIVIMPGGFHPFHAGHYALYQSAQRTFPDAEVYVAATNDTSARPFPFPVKEKLAKLAGVEAGHFVQVKSPFRAEEITSKFDPNRDTLIFVRSEKDSTKPPQPGGVKKDGSPSYLQPLLGAKKLEPFARHAYMAYLPTVEFGPGMTSATEIRAAWPQLNEKRKTALVMSLYPRTQGNAKLAATVVGLLDAAIGTQGVAEGWFSSSKGRNQILVDLGLTDQKLQDILNREDIYSGYVDLESFKDFLIPFLENDRFIDDIDSFAYDLTRDAVPFVDRMGGTDSVEHTFKRLAQRINVAIKNHKSKNQTIPQNPSLINKKEKDEYGRIEPSIDEQGVAESAPIVVAQAPIDVRNPKKAAQPYRNQGDIVPDTKPPSTEKRGVKGRPGQRPMPQHNENTDYLDE